MRVALLTSMLLRACGDSAPPRDASLDASADASDARLDVWVDAADDAAHDAPVDVSEADAGPPPPPPSEPGRHDVAIVETRRVIPGDGLPAETMALASNNNLDVVRHGGRVYLAWRTAPDHFAGADTVMYVVSSDDERTWTFELEVALGTDVREPGLLSWNGRLFFYYSILGTNRFTFDPMGVRAVERMSDGSWTAPVDIGLTGYVVWRVKTERGTPYMTCYAGGEHIYSFDGGPLEIELRTTADALTWTPIAPTATPMQTHVYRGGGSEMDFTFGDDGTLFAVIRKEGIDERGWGSMVCRAPSGDPAAFECRHDPRKYDSPRMWWYDGEAYLLARRNVTETGHFDLEDPERVDTLTAIMYHARYAAERKRCALWRYVQDEDRIAFIADLPSSGDTCFASAIPGDAPDRVVVYNYSSDFAAEDEIWSTAQRRPTQIYRHLLQFTPR